ncbi:tetratricopeptide repeat protein (plasmid) [Acinetobacter lwoffii]|uniref:tetratricopeptide repeat protein n=2 Tax=Acinetobacter lwoffii TaxID=28090 RepID=UPI00110D0744|nr:tetratricopeptide repeat protein [Acinetobacter lwoffii]QXB87624.1 tetratricopeptide repeat protein [Acinetobacter lwoffii]TMS55152.1 tetratricopeptide repeat protein [Acinetobacter lwoffii]
MLRDKLVINVSHHDSSYVSLSSVKDLLNQLDINEEKVPQTILKYLYLFFPLNENVRVRFYNSNLSLTESISPDQRIRYRFKEILDKNYIAVIQYINTLFNCDIKVNIKTRRDLDENSLTFYRIARIIGKWDVSIDYSNSEYSSYINNDDLKVNNLIFDFLKYDFEKSKYHDLIDIAFEYINAGDALTALNIGEILKTKFQDKYIWNLLSISELILGNKIKSEYYSNKWVESDDDLFKIDSTRALYSKAMLYVRLHSKELLDVEKSKNLLNEAYELMLNSTITEENDDFEKLTFEKIFNRNGYALILFKEGKLLDAKLQILECLDNINKYHGDDINNKINIHKSVLLYNLAQCYEKLGMIDDAISTFKILLELDPNMDEYYLDLSRCYGVSEQVENAIFACETATKIEPYNYQNWAMLAYWQNHMGHYDKSSNSYLKAYNLCPEYEERLRNINNYAYNFLLLDENNNYSDILGLIKDSFYKNSILNDENEIVRGYSLMAEIYLRSNDYVQAKNVINDALSIFENNESLINNLEFINDLTN